MIKIGILGGSGYGGAELLRLLLPHPMPKSIWLLRTSKPANQWAKYIEIYTG